MTPTNTDAERELFEAKFPPGQHIVFEYHCYKPASVYCADWIGVKAAEQNAAWKAWQSCAALSRSPIAALERVASQSAAEIAQLSEQVQSLDTACAKQEAEIAALRAGRAQMCREALAAINALPISDLTIIGLDAAREAIQSLPD